MCGLAGADSRAGEPSITRPPPPGSPRPATALGECFAWRMRVWCCLTRYTLQRVSSGRRTAGLLRWGSEGVTGPVRAVSLWGRTGAVCWVLAGSGVRDRCSEGGTISVTSLLFVGEQEAAEG